MTPLNTHSRGENARKANTPWRTDRTKRPARRKPRSQMTRLEIECGISEAQHDEFHKQQRERVFARYGVKP